MARKKFSLQFDGIEELAKKFEELGGDLNKAAENALKASKQAVNPGIQSAIAKHRLTGDTEASLDTNMDVEWQGTVASIKVGFNIDNGGLPSIFLMYGAEVRGTPRTKKDQKLYNSIYGTAIKRQVEKVQRETFEKMINRRMEG